MLNLLANTRPTGAVLPKIALLLAAALVLAPASYGKGKPPIPGDGGGSDDGSGGGSAPSYSVELIADSVGPQAYSTACAMNETGDVVGWFQVGDPVYTGAFLSFIGGSGSRFLIDLNDLISDDDLQLLDAVDINDEIDGIVQITGQVVIFAADGTFERKGYRMDLSIDGDVVTGSNLHIIGPDETAPIALNNFGDVVGNQSGTTPYRYTDALGFEALPQFPSGSATAMAATDINDAGVIAGYTNASTDVAWRFTDTGGFEDLGKLVSRGQVAATGGINSAGTIVGHASGGKSRGYFTLPSFIYTEEGGMQSLGLLGDDRTSITGAISDGNVVVGRSGSRAYVYHSDFGMVDLNVQVSGSPSLREANDVNNLGQICGETDDGRAYLLSPVE